MAIVVVDCDEARRPLIAQRVARGTGGVTPQFMDAIPENLEPGTLLICHVGDRQHEHERRALGDKLSNAVTTFQCIIAGFTGGVISPHFVRQMPPQGSAFVINDSASFAEVSEPFGIDIQRLAEAWRSYGAKLRGESLAQAWIGYDPALEAILEILVELLRGAVPIDGVDDVADHLAKFGMPNLDENLRAIVNSKDEAGRLANIAQLRDHLFRSRPRRGLME